MSRGSEERPAGEHPTAPLPEQPASPPVHQQSHGQQPYGAPSYGYPSPAYQVQRKTNGFAVAALVLGIVWIYWIGSILALIFGMMAKSQIDQSGGTQQGRGMAVAGIVLGWVGIGFLLLWILLFGIAGCAAVAAS